MKNKKILAFLMTITVTFSAFAPIKIANAEESSESDVELNMPQTISTELHNNTFFSDLGQNNWATKYIVRMNVRGIVTGYSDNTFKPTQGINQAEAITMLIRFLGYDKEIEQFNSIELSEEHELSQVLRNVPKWAKGSVAIAYQVGLLDYNNYEEFKPSAEASRAWIAKMVVDGVKKRGNVVLTESAPMFTDSNSIPSWAINSINEAVQSQIITGYADGSFKPNNTVTRAELTALLYRAEKYVSQQYLENVLNGTIEKVEDKYMIINLGNDQLKKIYYSNQPIVYFETNQIETNQLKVGDQVSALTDSNGYLVFLDIIDGPSRTEISLDGKIYLLDLNKQLITIENSQGKMSSYKLTEETLVVKDGMTLLVRDLNEQDTVGLVVKGNSVVKIEVLVKYLNKTQGEIISLNLDKKIITIQFEGGSLEVYNLNEAILIQDTQGNSETLSNFKTGERVDLVFEEDRLTKIQSQKYTINNAEISEFNTKAKTIGLVMNGVPTTYSYSSDLKVSINGYSNAIIIDLKEGDKVKALITENEVAEIEVTSRERKFYTYISADTSAKAIKVQSIDNQEYHYLSYHDEVIATRDGVVLTSITKLNSNERIVISLVDDKIQTIEEAQSATGTVLEINQEDKSIRIKGRDNKKYYYTFGEESFVKINDTVTSIDKLSVDDYVTFYVFNDYIIEISK